MQNDPLVQELNDYLDANNLPPTEKLLLRMAKHSYVQGIQIKEDVAELASHNKECKENPSIASMFKSKPMGTTTMIFTIGLIIYAVLEVVNHTLGFEAVLKTLLP